MISTLAGNAAFGKDAIFLEVKDLYDIASTYENELARWAQLFGKTKTVLRCAEEKLTIPAHLFIGGISVSNEILEVFNQLWFANNVAVSPQLLHLGVGIIESPGIKGIVRLRDERQVVMHEQTKRLLFSNKPAKYTTELCRAQYMHPEDLYNLRREIRQQASADGSLLEYTYRAFDPELGPFDTRPGNWRQFTSTYRLYDGGDSDFYQVCENLGIEDLAEAPII